MINMKGERTKQFSPLFFLLCEKGGRSVSNELWRTLINTSALSPMHRNATEFYKDYKNNYDYSKLNYYHEISPLIIQRIQMKYLFELQNRENMVEKLYKINQIIENFSKRVNLKDELKDKIEKEASDNVLIYLLNLLNSPFSSNKNSFQKRIFKNAREKTQAVNGLVQELSELLTAIGYKKLPKIKFEKFFKNALLNNWESGAAEAGFEKYVHWKAQLLEDAVVAIINQDPDFSAINSGRFYAKSDKQQLIQDMFIVPDTDYHIKFNNNLSFELHQKGKVIDTKTTKNMSGFFTQIEKIKDKTISVHIPDELYEVLKKFTKVQIKSGFNTQTILNANDKNAITLKEIGGSEAGPFLGLQKLYDTDPKYINVGASSETLSSWANYLLSKEIAKTSLSHNDVYFTDSGFMTAAQWLGSHNYILKFKPDVNSVTSDLLTRSRTYMLMASGVK